MRYQWRLDSVLDGNEPGKNRNDHRNHAIDAAVVAACDRSLIQRMSNAAKRAEEKGGNRLFEHLDLPWPEFRDDLKASLEKLVVSHRPNHSVESGLHTDTNYGLREPATGKGDTPLVVHRIPIKDLNIKRINDIDDPVIREQVRHYIEASDTSKKSELKKRLEHFTSETGIRRVRIVERISVIPVRDRQTGEAYRHLRTDGNYCYDIFERENGKWDGRIVTTFEANTKSFRRSLEKHKKPKKSVNGNELVMRLRKNDLIAIDEGIRIRIMRVAQFTRGKIMLAEHMEANVDRRARDKESGFSYLTKSPDSLRALNARLVGVNPLGYVNYPGGKR